MRDSCYITSDRKLEQFFYAHRIRFDSQHQYCGKTHWVYTVTIQLLHVAQEYITLLEGNERLENAD